MFDSLPTIKSRLDCQQPPTHGDDSHLKIPRPSENRGYMDQPKTSSFPPMKPSNLGDSLWFIATLMKPCIQFWGDNKWIINNHMMPHIHGISPVICGLICAMVKTWYITDHNGISGLYDYGHPYPKEFLYNPTIFDLTMDHIRAIFTTYLPFELIVCNSLILNIANF